MPNESKIEIKRPFPPIKPTERAIRQLAAAIICQAVEDWILLIKRGRYAQTSAVMNYKEIRRFLTTGLGEDLCDYIQISPEVILAELERHRHNFNEHGILPPTIFKYNKPEKYD
jgi:hypothetical protein